MALMITWPVDRLEHDKRQMGISEAEMMAVFSLSSVVLDEEGRDKSGRNNGNGNLFSFLMITAY